MTNDISDKEQPECSVHVPGFLQRKWAIACMKRSIRFAEKTLHSKNSCALNQAEHELKRAANHLGFDLVKSKETSK